ncbi:MAG: orotate phosphoribosyltransferase [candidate division Zixibacteria bacterium]|nr:orotate phosphoribosyltransferase [candidate division Zixibacteria bacterium]
MVICQETSLINSNPDRKVNVDKREKLKEIIKQDALKFGDFVLASGKRSNYYLNGKMVTLSSKGLILAGELIYDICRELEIDAVGGPTLGADPIIGAVLAVAGLKGKHLDGFIVRKETKDHGTKSLIEGPLEEGDRVLMVEDVVTTAGTWIKAANAVKEHGADIVTMVCLVDRESGAAENLRREGYDFKPLFFKSDFGV